MIARLKPYPRMKDAGVEWLGEIPQTWDVRRNGRLFAQRNETGFSELPILEVSLRTGVRIRDFENSDRKQVMSDREKYKRARSGDIAYNMMRMWQGAVGVAPTDGLISPAYVVARPLEGTKAEYYSRLFRTPAYMQEIDNYSRGIVKDRNRLYWADFKAIPSCCPPPEEQDAIVRYLDYVDQRVRRLVRTKQKLIALLTEQKQAIIHRAVTRGLDPDVQLKDSGVEWLGQVPEHWEIIRNAHLVQLTTGFPFKSEGFSKAETDIRLLRGVNVSPGLLRWDDVVRWPARDRGEFEAFELEVGDIVLGMDRPIISSGVRVAQVTQDDLPCLLLQRVARIRPHKGLDPDFLLHLLAGSSFIEYLTPIFTGISVPHLSPEQIRSFRVALPPHDEQVAIIAHLKKATAIFDRAISDARREIELLIEYRTRLVADVVTGQLDVRKAAAALPEVDPLDLDDESDDIASEEVADVEFDAVSDSES